MAAGDFTPSVLLKIQLKAEQMWQDSQFANSLMPHADAAIALLENQTARFTELQDPGKDRTVQINWVNPCAIVAEDCESNCDITEAELETDGKDYTLDLCKKAGFSIDAEKFRTNVYDAEETTAVGLARAITVLDEWWAQQVLVKLKAFAGVNVYPTPWTWNPATSDTEIPTLDYNLDIIPDLLFQAQKNRMANPYFINNGDLQVAWNRAMLNAGNLDGKGDEAAIKAIRMYFDSWNFGTAGVTENIFSVAPGAVAMKTKVRHSTTPQVIGGSIQQTRYAVKSRLLPGVSYDVYYTLKCVTVNNKAHDVHSWRFETNGGIFLNPEGCPVTVESVVYSPTGVLSYAKV